MLEITDPERRGGEPSFTVHSGNAFNGTIYCMVQCSEHENIATAVMRDVTDLNAKCRQHCLERHSGIEFKFER